MENQVKEKMSTGRIIVDILIWILVIFAALITFSVFSSQANGGVANIFGNMPVTIQTNSMAPTFQAGDLIIDKTVTNASSLKAGNIITFWTTIEGKRVKNTHKIIEVKTDGSFVTRGDANDINDTSPVSPSDVIGVFSGTKFGGVGKALDFLQSPMGFLFVVVLPLLLFFLYQIYKFIIVVVSIKKPKLSAMEEEEIKKKAVEEYLKNQEQENSNDPQ